MSEILTGSDFLPLALGAGMLVAALLLLFILVSTLAVDQKRLRRRLARVSSGQTAGGVSDGNAPTLRRDTTDSSIASFDKLIKRFLPHPAKLRDRLSATGRHISIGEYVLACLLVAALSFGLRFLTGEVPFFAAVLLGIASGLGVPHATVSFMIKRRRNRFVMLLPEAIDLMVRGLRSGLPISESMKIVGQEIPDPVGVEFRRIIEAVSIGVTLERALWATAERLGVPEFRFFAISLSVQQETGGNLTETLANLGEVLRRRKQVKLKIRALTGEARASASILGALPFIMFGALLLIRPEYGMVLVNTHQGRVFLGIGFVSIALGIGVMTRMTKFEI
jgi:tight adherence protein B